MSSKIFKFLTSIPSLCNAPNSSRWSRLIELQFHDELLGGSQFDENDDDKVNPLNRMQTLWGFTAFGGDKDKIDYCKRMVALIGLMHYKEQHKIDDYDGMIEILKSSLASDEADNSDVASVLSVSDAVSTASEQWN